MTFDEIVSRRRSIRRYQTRPVDDAALTAVLEAGRQAPSARNGQPWKVTVVRDASTLQRLAAACNDQQLVAEAGTALVIWTAEDRLMACGQSVASVDCTIALSFMMLKATELGLGTCWLGAFSADAVKQVLGLPPAATVVAVTPLGHPAEQPDARPRKSLAELCDIREAGL